MKPLIVSNSFSKKTIRVLLIFSISLAAVTTAASAAEVNIYSARQPFLIAPILKEFTQQTGIVTNIIYTRNGLVKRLEIEGNRSAADVILSSDVSPLHQLAKLGLTQSVDSDILKRNIPKHYRDPNNQWFGLTSRARIIYAAKERVDPTQPIDYEDLTSAMWKNRICSRSANHNYMRSLIASIMIAKGETFTEQWLLGVKQNLARKPQGNDRAQVKAISEGVCDIALVNSYYFGKMLNNKRKSEQIKWAKSINLIFPNQSGRGSHMNISGIALSKNAPNRASAIRLMEYLSGDSAQYQYAQKNYEFPVRKATPHSKLLLEHMPNFKQDEVSLAAIAEQSERVTALLKRVKFDL